MLVCAFRIEDEGNCTRENLRFIEVQLEYAIIEFDPNWRAIGVRKTPNCCDCSWQETNACKYSRNDTNTEE